MQPSVAAALLLLALLALLRGKGLISLKLFNTWDVGPAQACTQLTMSDLHTLSAAQCVISLASLPWHYNACDIS
jgi:hypothetical protein